MKSLDKKILNFVNKVSRRIKLNFFLDKLLMGLNASLALILFILIASSIITFEYSYELSFIALILIISISIVVGIMKGPNKNQISLIVDSKGLDERVTTSLEFINDESEIAIAQKKDTLDKIKDFNIKEKLPIRIRKQEMLRLIGLIIACLIVVAIPTNAKKEASKLRNFRKIKNETIEKIEKEEAKALSVNDLTEEEKKKLKKMLDDTKKEIKDLNKNDNISKLMNRLDKKIEVLKDATKSEKGKKLIEDIKKNIINEQKTKMTNEALKNLNELNKRLKNSEKGKEILEAMKSGDKNALERKLKELNDSLNNLSDSEKSKLSNELLEAASNLTDEDLKNLLEQASENILDGQLTSSEELANALAELSQSATGVDASSSISVNSSSSNKNSNSNNGNSGSGSGQGNGKGSGNGSGSGSGSGTGKGSGNGSGKGGGSGWNTGSKNGVENMEEPNSGEQVFIPGRKDGNDDNLTGDKNKSGSTQSIETQSGLNLDGQKVQYDNIIGDYSKQEIDSMDKSTIPQSLQDVVKNYFSELE